MSARAVSTRAGAALVAGAALLVLTCAGGGGRDALAALAWQLGAVAAAALVASLPRDPFLAPLRTAATITIVIIAASALQADRVEASREQALAWTLAVVPAVALVAGARRLGKDARLDAPLVSASCAFLAIQLAGELGHPLLGRAGGVQPGRPLGTFFDPNQLAATLAIVAAIHAPRASAAGWGRAHAALALLFAGCAVATRSRVAVLAVGALVLAEAWRRRRASGRALGLRARIAVAAGLVLVVVAGALVAWSRRGDPDAWMRPMIWRGAAPAAMERPLLGLGPAAFQSEWPRFQQPVERGLSRFARSARTPHGEWLRLPIEIGAAGVAALALLLFAVARLSRGHAADALSCAATAIPIFAVHDALHSPAFLAWLATGLALPLAATRAGPSSEERGGARLATALVLAGLAAMVVRTQVSQRLLERSLAEVRHGAAAEEPLRRSLDLEPRDVEGLLWQAELDADHGLAASLHSEALIERAAILAPRDAEAALDRARRLASLRGRAAPPGPAGPLAQAYEKAAALAPFDATRRAEAAGNLVFAGDPATAILLAREALDLEPHLVRARAWLVVALDESGDAQEAAAQRALLLADLAQAQRPDLTEAEAKLLEIEPRLLEAAGVSR